MTRDMTHCFQLNLARLLGAISVVICLTGMTLGQSIVNDDAHTSTAPKDLDANFGTNPNLTVSSSNNTYLGFRLFAAHLGHQCGRQYSFKAQCPVNTA